MSPADRAMLEYAEAITKDPRTIGPASLGGLRAAGFDDTAILQITMIASWFNYINRMADALGVGRGDAVVQEGTEDGCRNFAS